VIILDTNVVSELMRPAPSTSVAGWIGAQAVSSLAITTVALAEVCYGLERLPSGKRRAELEHKFELFLVRGFAARVLPFDEASARAYGRIVSTRERSGRPVDAFDAMIAAIAQTHKATVATRDTAGFWGCGVKLVNPFL
jgi:toxin FitB